MSIVLASASSQYFTSPFIYDPDIGGFGVGMWIKATSWNSNLSGSRILIQQNDGGGTGRTWLQVITDSVSTNVQKLHSFLGNVNTYGSTNLNGMLNRWLHVGLTITTGPGTQTLKLWLNGAEDASATIDAAACTSGTMRFGAHKVPSATVDYWNGKLAEIAIFSTGSIGSGDFQLMYNSGVGNKASVYDGGALAYSWPLASDYSSGTGTGSLALTGVNTPTFDVEDHMARKLSNWAWFRQGG